MAQEPRLKISTIKDKLRAVRKLVAELFHLPLSPRPTQGDPCPPASAEKGRRITETQAQSRGTHPFALSQERGRRERGRQSRCRRGHLGRARSTCLGTVGAAPPHLRQEPCPCPEGAPVSLRGPGPVSRSETPSGRGGAGISWVSAWRQHGQVRGSLTPAEELPAACSHPNRSQRQPRLRGLRGLRGGRRAESGGPSASRGLGTDGLGTDAPRIQVS